MKKTIILLTSLLYACSFMGSNNISFAVHTDPLINQNIYQQSSPISIAIYQLKAANTEKNSSKLLTLQNINYSAENIITKNEIFVRPNQNIEFKEKILPTTRYILLVPEFRIGKESQIKIIDLQSDNVDRIEIHIENNSLTINNL